MTQVAEGDKQECVLMHLEGWEQRGWCGQSGRFSVVRLLKDYTISTTTQQRQPAQPLLCPGLDPTEERHRVSTQEPHVSSLSLSQTTPALANT